MCNLQKTEAVIYKWQKTLLKKTTLKNPLKNTHFICIHLYSDTNTVKYINAKQYLLWYKSTMVNGDSVEQFIQAHKEQLIQLSVCLCVCASAPNQTTCTLLKVLLFFFFCYNLEVINSW